MTALPEAETLLDAEIAPLGLSDLVRYAGAGGDFAAMHYDDQLAKRIGYPSVFAHGLLTAGLTSSVLSGHFGLTAIEEFQVRYVAQVWPGDPLRVVARRVAADQVRLKAAVTVSRRGADGQEQVVLEGHISVARDRIENG